MRSKQDAAKLAGQEQRATLRKRRQAGAGWRLTRGARHMHSTKPAPNEQCHNACVPSLHGVMQRAVALYLT